MGNPIVDEAPTSHDSTPTISQFNSDVPETRSSQPPPPGTDDNEEFPFKWIHEQDTEKNSKINESAKATEIRSADILTKSDDLNLADVSMDIVTLSSSDKSEKVNESQQAVEVGKKDSVCASQLDVTNSLKAVEKTLATPEKTSAITEQSSKKIEDIDSNKSNLSNALETIPKSLPQTRTKSEKNSSSRILSKRRSRKESSISHSSRRKFSRSRSISYSPRRRFSRSRSPVRFPALSKSEKRNYRRHSPSSSSSPSLRRYRSRSPSRRRCYSSASYSSSSVSSPHRRRHNSSKPINSRSAEKRYNRDSYEYCEAFKEVKYGSRSRVHRRERSTSLSPKNRRSSKRRSHSTSPKERLHRMLVHENLSKNSGCVVRFDASKSFSSRQDFNNTEDGRRNIARVTSEVRVEVKSTVNSEKLTEDDKKNLFQQKIRVIKKRLRHERREFRKRPESYPTFAEEWKLFWCNRFKQIQADGKEDPHNYDYKPDWTRYWLVRIKQIFKEKYKKLKSDLKEDLGVSGKKKSENVMNSEVVEISDGQESASPWEDETKNGSAEPKIDCQENNSKNVESNESKQESNEENSAANALSSVSMEQLNLLTQTISACMSSACSQNSAPLTESASNLKYSQPASLSLVKSDNFVDIDLNNDISVISVLRQLSVLEIQLGSSATQITNLLANGLAREKKQAGSSIRLLTQENRLFLDVIKEKLKGQLILEVVPNTMIKATKRCIKSIDELMRFIPEPKLLDSRLNKNLQENPNSASSPASLATTTHVSFNARNNLTFSTYSMPSVFPSTAVHSVPAHNPPVHVHSASKPPTMVQAVASQPQYPVRSEPYHAPVSFRTSLKTEYHPMNSDRLINQRHFMAGSVASMPLTTPPQIPHMSSSTRFQLPSSISSAGPSRTILASSTNRNFQAAPPTLFCDDTRVTSVNLPSNDSKLHSTISTFDSVNTAPMTFVSCNSAVSTGNSIFNNIPTTTSTASQVTTASSSTAVVNSSTITTHAIEPIIDLTDDSPDYDESKEPIKRLSEERIIQLLKNFRQLPRARQQELVDFLRELEKTNLAIVEDFKKYVLLPFNE